ncbi:acyltransferase family protein [Corynebacterium variabile]|uniref:Predicted acyltransferases n=1 Tax=Corynebacterium variabile TaxID=1727 RepID=A0A0X2NKW6_9CORY|nr:acyltransferase family protein [Corynebacterium variabile]CUU66137.1 Predicted acyltransferases [Corynebacterium variabile]
MAQKTSPVIVLSAQVSAPPAPRWTPPPTAGAKDETTPTPAIVLAAPTGAPLPPGVSPPTAAPEAAAEEMVEDARDAEASEDAADATDADATDAPDAPTVLFAIPQAAVPGPPVAPVFADEKSEDGSGDDADAEVDTADADNQPTEHFAAQSPAQQTTQKPAPSVEHAPSGMWPAQNPAAAAAVVGAATTGAAAAATTTEAETTEATEPPEDEYASQAEPAYTAEDPAPVKPLKPGRIRRVPGLDGLRGIAVLAVVIYHFFGDALPGGFLGVDIFFVLSGFLITALLVRELGATGRISLKEFWRRRARRIIPASVTVLVLATAVAGFIGGDVQVGLVPQFLGSLFFANNWVQISQSHSYFADTTPQIFMHYWSLAIEEQFYVLWPLIFLGLLWVARRSGRSVSSGDRTFRLPALFATVAGLASLLVMILLYNPDEDPSRVYFGTDTHAFGLLAGVVLALLVTTASPKAVDSWPLLSPTGASGMPTTRSRLTGAAGWTLGSLAFLGLIAMLVLLPDTSPVTYRGGLFGASLLTVAVMMTVLRDAGPVAWMMRIRPLRYFGERSFSLYLWHWPVIVFLEAKMQQPGSDTPDWLVGLIAVVISLVLSEASYRFVENPLRRQGYRRVVAAMGSTKLLVVPIAILVIALFAGSALGGSPSKSELERQLDEIADLQNSPAPPPPPGASTPPGLPDGTEITGIGDSVMLASTVALQQRFPGMTIDAEVSRHYSGGEGSIQAMVDDGSMGEYVVLGFGTNGQAFDGELDQIRDMLGPDRKMILVVPFGYVDGIQDAADQVIAYAAENPDVYLAPWCQQAVDHPEDLIGDGVHPDEQGQQLYADAVEDALRQAVAGKQDTSISCPM